MYKDHKRYNKNGYVIVNIPDHPKAFNATSDKNPETFCVYEHVLIAEEIIDRSIKEGEVVHHLDENRSNNSPDNLLVLSGPMHGKLHSWLNKHDIIAKGNHVDRVKSGCIRCVNCEKPIPPDFKYCSVECNLIYQRTQVRASGNPDHDNNPSRSKIRPSKEILEKKNTRITND